MRDGKELKPCLSGRGVTKVFGFGDAKTVAVDHVDFDFHEGEFVSIVGESGSGKTTLSKMLLGLISVTEDEIDLMPPLRHKYPGEIYNIENSEVIQFLAEKENIMNLVFVTAAYNGLIIMNSDGSFIGKNNKGDQVNG